LTLKRRVGYAWKLKFGITEPEDFKKNDVRNNVTNHEIVASGRRAGAIVVVCRLRTRRLPDWPKRVFKSAALIERGAVSRSPESPVHYKIRDKASVGRVQSLAAVRI
jgi:hypothetical protein